MLGRSDEQFAYSELRSLLDIGPGRNVHHRILQCIRKVHSLAATSVVCTREHDLWHWCLPTPEPRIQAGYVNGYLQELELPYRVTLENCVETPFHYDRNLKKMTERFEEFLQAGPSGFTKKVDWINEIWQDPDHPFQPLLLQ